MCFFRRIPTYNTLIQNKHEEKVEIIYIMRHATKILLFQERKTESNKNKTDLGNEPKWKILPHVIRASQTN